MPDVDRRLDTRRGVRPQPGDVAAAGGAGNRVPGRHDGTRRHRRRPRGDVRRANDKRRHRSPHGDVHTSIGSDLHHWRDPGRLHGPRRTGPPGQLCIRREADTGRARRHPVHRVWRQRDRRRERPSGPGQHVRRLPEPLPDRARTAAERRISRPGDRRHQPRLRRGFRGAERREASWSPGGRPRWRAAAP